jgi:hypothetical protein
MSKDHQQHFCPWFPVSVLWPSFFAVVAVAAGAAAAADDVETPR